MDEILDTTGWRGLSPAFRAAALVSAGVVALEVISDLLPGVGFLVTTPLAILLYYYQGNLAGRLARQDRRYVLLKPGEYAWVGARSALWTGAVLSPLVALASLVFLTPLTAGAILVGLPAIVGASLLDLLLNLGFSALGAWVFARTGSRVSPGAACLGLALALFAAWTLVSILVVILILLGLRLLSAHLPGLSFFWI